MPATRDDYLVATGRLTSGSGPEAPVSGQDEDDTTGETPAPPESTAEQKLNAMVAKLQELGLPLIDPKLAALSP